MNARLELFAAILNGQNSGEGSLTTERIRSALVGRPPFNKEEIQLIWTSPDVRAHVLAIRREVRRELSESFRASDLGYSERRLAAAGGESDAQEVEGKGFRVLIFRDDVPGEEWSISCHLEATYHNRLPPRTFVTLRDTGGLVWASGIPDDQGRFGGVWAQKGEEPAERLKRHTLWLDP